MQVPSSPVAGSVYVILSSVKVGRMVRLRIISLIGVE